MLATIAFLSSQLHSSSRILPESQWTRPFMVNFNGILSLSSMLVNHLILSSSWILEIGATHHASCSLKFFFHSNPINNLFVTFLDDHSIPISHIRSMKLSNNLIFINGLFVPKFNFNLLFVSAITRSHHYSIIFLFYS